MRDDPTMTRPRQRRSISVRRASFALALAVLFGAALLASPATGMRARALSINCPGYVKGPIFSVSGHSSHLYGVEVEGVSCSFARPWVSRLVTESSSGPLHAPPGWTCLPSPGLGRYTKLAAGGGCGPGRLTSLASLSTASKFFGWHAVV
jgi:hypothetical protein